ncbi:MAG: bacterial transcriptional activator domain-containing protein [Burkholderiales bacterium]|nr:bacterial transcriptional activator domain-containing protein [Burkholderiales bacterium]
MTTGSDVDTANTERTLALYRGAFLPDDSDASFAIAMRERLRAKFVHALGELGRQLESSGRYDDAIGWYLRGLEADAVIEPFHQGLMRCYAALDRRTEAIAAYRRLRQTLSVMLGLQPSATTERLYQSLRSSGQGGGASPQL